MIQMDREDTFSYYNNIPHQRLESLIMECYVTFWNVILVPLSAFNLFTKLNPKSI